MMLDIWFQKAMLFGSLGLGAFGLVLLIAAIICAIRTIHRGDRW